MFALGFVLFAVIISLGLLIFTAAMRSLPLALLNLSIWILGTLIVAPWSHFSVQPPLDPDERLAWNAMIGWAFFLAAAILATLYAFVARKVEARLPKRRRRRRRSRSDSDGTPADDAQARLREI